MHKLILVPAMLLLLLLSACSSAQTDSASSQDGPQQPCSEAGQHRASEYAPGQLVASTELEPDDDNEDFPTGARAWRVLYTSTGKDNTDLQLVCGVVIAPADPERIASAGPGGNGRMASWTHGTVGVQAHCQPSVQPERNIWGPMPGGFNVVAWGEPGKADGRRGTSQGGALQYMVERGWVVSATDYFAESRGRRPPRAVCDRTQRGIERNRRRPSRPPPPPAGVSRALDDQLRVPHLGSFARRSRRHVERPTGQRLHSSHPPA